MSPEQQIAHFQCKILELLDQDLSADEIRAELLRDPNLEPFYPYIAAYENRMLFTAAELVQKWGHRMPKTPK